MLSIAVGILGVPGHRKETSTGNEENIEEVNGNFITMKGNLGIKKRKKVAEK